MPACSLGSARMGCDKWNEGVVSVLTERLVLERSQECGEDLALEWPAELGLACGRAGRPR